MKVRSIVSIAISIAHLLGSLLFLWIILGWRIRRTRGAFEKQLVLQGMSKEDAKRMSAQFSKLKDNLLGTIRSGMRQF